MSPAPRPSDRLRFGLSHDSFGRLVLINAEGERHVGVEPIRCFPLTDHDHWIALVDSQGHEVALVENLTDLPEGTRDLLQQDLARREFAPRLQKIKSRHTAADWSEWDVETDRGPTTLRIKSEDDVRRLGTHRVLVIDAQGIRYLIEDVRQLDSGSRRILEHYL